MGLTIIYDHLCLMVNSDQGRLTANWIRVCGAGTHERYALPDPRQWPVSTYIIIPFWLDYANIKFIDYMRFYPYANKSNTFTASYHPTVHSPAGRKVRKAPLQLAG